MKKRAARIQSLVEQLQKGSGGRAVVDELLAIGPDAIEPLIAGWWGAVGPRDEADALADAVARFGKAATLPLAAHVEKGDVPSQAAWVLGQLHDTRALPALIAATKSKNSQMRWAASHGLGFLRDRRGEPALIARLRDRSSNVRYAAIEALGKVGGRDALAALEPLADDTGLGIGRFASEAVARIRARKL